MRQHVVIGAVLLLGTGASATPVKLDEQELRAMIAGKTVKIDTPLGVPLTVSYGANGLMTGTVGTVLAAYLGSAKDRGRWSVRNGLLCQKWFKWLDAEETCMEVRQDGPKIHWRTDTGKTGTAMIEPGPPVLAGASASGLGLPMRPDPAPEEQAPPAAAETMPQLDPSPELAATWPAPRSQHEAQPHPDPARKAVVAQPHRHPASPRGDRSVDAASVREAAAGAEPALVDPPREIVRASPAAWRPVHALSIQPVSLVNPTPSLVPPPAGAVHPATGPDSASGTPQPMRLAAELVLAESLEHRWCLASALATGPVTTGSPELSIPVVAPAATSTPNLLAVSAEQLSPDELPLYEPSCLTAGPALVHVATRDLGRY
ncbi:MAG: hypothetical protein SFW09_00285 [Hyphomicrobiaceae bacterium]|nr:hypothetical protein [Hyphomicrobiaceae bacterium]